MVSRTTYVPTQSDNYRSLGRLEEFLVAYALCHNQRQQLASSITGIDKWH